MSDPPISRGFRGRRPGATSARVPPGQHLVERLSGAVGGTDAGAESGELALHAARMATRRSANGRWAEFNALPQTDVTVDIHCVTTWSKLDTDWHGVFDRHVAGGRGPERAASAVRSGPLRRRLHHQRAGRGSARWQGDGGDAVTTANRSIPSTAGRRVCWCRISTSGRARSGCGGCNSSTPDEPGFWEELGYHIYGDPWREQRYDWRLIHRRLRQGASNG